MFDTPVIYLYKDSLLQFTFILFREELGASLHGLLTSKKTELFLVSVVLNSVSICSVHFQQAKSRGTWNRTPTNLVIFIYKYT